MKKVLIIVPGFEHGGTNRTLCNYLTSGICESVDISILAMDIEGPYKERFAQYNLLPIDDFLVSALHFRKTFRLFGGFKKLKCIFLKAVYNLILAKNESRLFRLASRKYNKYHFDIVIGFQEGSATDLSTYINAKEHMAWIHCDYNNYLLAAGKTDESEMYAQIDRMVCVSKYTANVFASNYPTLSSRVQSIYNFMDTNGIKSGAKDKITDITIDSSLFKLICVGRMNYVKRFSHIPFMARKMRDYGCDFKWYIIGSGGNEENIVREEIERHNVGENVILLGAKDNPYPYIAVSDVLVCPSSSEACPNVVNEAKILHVPVVAADFPTAYEYIDDGVNGIIAPIEKIAERLTELCKNKEYYREIKRGISTFEYRNDEILKAVEDLLLGEN